MTMAGVASARDGGSDKCFQILWFSFCPPTTDPAPVKAPEIDPASAMAGLTMLAGGLVVFNGRRKIIFKGLRRTHEYPGAPGARLAFAPVGVRAVPPGPTCAALPL